MVNRKKIRTRGKLPLKRYFQKLEKGERVAIKIERAMQSSFPKRIQGRTGIVEGKKGKVYIIELNDQNKKKRFLIE
jgi:ribosomal protein L21E